jgi:hypothetical protein
MAGAPALTAQQKRRLAGLEPRLRALATQGDYSRAKVIAAEIQEILRASGHETRLMQSKNWLFQAAMEAGKLTVAQNGLEGVRKKSSPRTRVYLEATALQAVCLLRQGNFVAAQPLIGESLRRCGNIRSDRRRVQFRQRMIERFEQEWVISVLRGEEVPRWDINQVQDEAGRLVQTSTIDEIEERLGGMVPSEQVATIFGVFDFSLKQLPASEQQLLPSPKERREQKEVGRTLLGSTRRVVWRSICDPSSDVYKLWYESGMRAVLDKKLLTASVVASLSGMRIGMYGLAVCMTAVVLKAGLEVFCDRFEPLDLMVERNDRR